MNRRAPRVPSRDRGVVLVITLLGLVLLAAMLFYVFNMGRHAEARRVTQDAADAGAVSGPGYVARSLNLVAHNNLGIARSLAMVNVLDAMPMTVEHTLLDQQAIATRMAELDRPSTFSGLDPLLEAALAAEVTRTRTQADSQVAWLQEVEGVFAASPVERVTHYNGPIGEGELWRAMRGMDAVSQATMENLGAVSQVAAVHAVEGNLLRHDGQATGVMYPTEPAIPWERGTFDDFFEPITDGRPVLDPTDDWTRRGPMDALYGWRDGLYWVTAWREIQQQPDSPSPDTRGVQTSPWIIQDSEIRGYRVIGFHDAAIRTYDGAGDQFIIENRWSSGDVEFAEGWVWRNLLNPWYAQTMSPITLPRGALLNRSRQGELENWLDTAPLMDIARPSFWHRQIAAVKLDYGWFPDEVDPNIGQPNWDLGLYAADFDPGGVDETCFLRITFRSTYINDRLESSPTLRETEAFWVNGWRPAPRVNPGSESSLIEIAPGAWLIQRPLFDADPEDEIEIIEDNIFIWVGVSRETPVVVSNPYDGLARDANDPAPVNLDHAAFPVSEDNRHEALRFLTVARRSNRSPFWSSRFDRGRVSDHHYALAQSRVFNNHSHDLWTPMWQARMEPIDRYGDWVTTALGSTDAANINPTLDAEALREIAAYLESLEPLAGHMLEH